MPRSPASKKPAAAGNDFGMKLPPTLPAWTSGDAKRDASFAIFRDQSGPTDLIGELTERDLPDLLALLSQPEFVNAGTPSWSDEKLAALGPKDKRAYNKRYEQVE